MREYLWVDADNAARLAREGETRMEQLRLGHGMLTSEQFVKFLASGELRVIVFKSTAACLVTLGESVEGVVLNILTVNGDMKSCEAAMPHLETAAREAGAVLIISVGAVGWGRVLARQGYTSEKRLIMRKELR